jgi:hypothetical protein
MAGEPYLDDPLAAELRTAISEPDMASTDSLQGYVGTSALDGLATHEFDMWMACATCTIFIPIPPSSAQSESRRGPCCVLGFDRARDAK